jgi:S-adenosylmethionine synthetase
MLVTHGTFSSEAVSSGHPDKIADQISDAILDACLAQDPAARVALECAIKGDLICLLGEITANARINAPEIARGVLRDVGHAGGAWGLYPDAMRVIEQISLQASEIGTGVDGEDPGAGDQGIMFGFACDEAANLMPAPIALANEICGHLHDWQTEAFPNICGPDAKTQVTLRYEDGCPVKLETVVISCQHAAHVGLAEIRDLLRSALFAAAARGGLLSALLTPETQLLINPAGTFHEGGPVADAGLTGRKIIADTYGGYARHGGGAFSGKDATKLDRSGAYAARQLARDVVARGWARACEVRLAYAIGQAAPVAVDFDTFGTGGDPAARYAGLGVDIAQMMRPRAIIERLGLARPIFLDTARNGHLGRPDRPWERPLLG